MTPQSWSGIWQTMPLFGLCGVTLTSSTGRLTCTTRECLVRSVHDHIYRFSTNRYVHVCDFICSSPLIFSLSMSGDCTHIVSASHDNIIKTWFMTPKEPDAPRPPKHIAKTDTTVLLTWQAPPAFNLEVTAFHIQHRIGETGQWVPEPSGLSVAPIFRSKMLTGLSAATPYQFRIRAENKMGAGPWSQPSITVSFS